MAKLKSFLKFEGSLGGLSFVKRNGEFYVRESNGVNGDVIKTDPRFERTRENNREFGNITVSSKLLREACNPLIRNAKDGLLHQRLTTLFAVIKNLDLTSVRGSRNVGTGILNAGVIDLLKGFDFNKKSPLHSVIQAPYQVNLATGEFSIASLTPGTDIIAPAGATHVKMAAGWLKIDFSQMQYELQLSPASTLALNYVASAVSLVPATAPTLGSAKDMYLVKIEFGQEINGIYYPLKNGDYNCVHVVEVQ